MQPKRERVSPRPRSELSDSSEDNLIFERRSANQIEERSLSGSVGAFSADDDRASDTKDGATVLLTEKERFPNVVVLGAPACGSWAHAICAQNHRVPTPQNSLSHSNRVHACVLQAPL